MSKKCLWEATIVFQIEFYQGFFKKHKVTNNHSYDIPHIFLSENLSVEDAQKYIEENFNIEDMEWVALARKFDFDTYKYKVLNRSYAINKVTRNIKELMSEMDSKDFLEYFKQEVYSDTNIFIQ